VLFQPETESCGSAKHFNKRACQDIRPVHWFLTDGWLLADCPVSTVAVGTTIADRPPRRSVRARLRIRLLLWMNGGETFCWPHTVQSLGHALPALCRTHV
jgi:hypothetical protein